MAVRGLVSGQMVIIDGNGHQIARACTQSAPHEGTASETAVVGEMLLIVPALRAPRMRGLQVVGNDCERLDFGLHSERPA